jgi:hypothetical protein
MDHSIYDADFFLNYGDLQSSITETAIFQTAFLDKRLRFVKTLSSEAARCPPAARITYPHVNIACCGVQNRGYKDSNGGDEPFGITLWY